MRRNLPPCGTGAQFGDAGTREGSGGRRIPSICLLALGAYCQPFAASAATEYSNDAIGAELLSIKQTETRNQVSLDSNWKFTLGDPPSAESLGFDDASWRKVNVPHDWSIEEPFVETNATGGAGGFLPAGVGWYRKHFSLPEDYAQRRIFVDFDGVMANSDVWINGFHLGQRPNGYVSFRYELTGHLDFGQSRSNVNVLAVRADNSVQPASRWYAGAGIYRHVRLAALNPVHFAHWGTFITAPNVTAAQAAVSIQTGVHNESDSARQVTLQSSIEFPDGRKLELPETKPQNIEPGKSVDIHQQATMTHPQLWDLEHPNLHRLSVKILSGGATSDEETVIFGICEARFEADTGFWLNGKNLKLKGVCLHHDGGAFGAAVPLSAWERRLKLLRQIGCNAIRTAHNPPAPEFFDLCDRMGLLVLDELFDCWTVGKSGLDGRKLADYHLYFNEWSHTDTRDIVLRDRNHPCIVAYSAGNEIHDIPNAPLAKRILGGLIEVFHENDPTRPVTQALFRPNASHDYTNGLADMLDVIGQNYRENELLAAHDQKPSRKILGTENGHDRNVWLALRDNPPYAGQFLWTGFDYLGESRRWPVIGAGSGLFDRTGAPRPRAFERQSWWSDRPLVYIVRRIVPERTTPADPGAEPLTRRQLEFSDWTPQNREAHEENVEVYSNCEQVELLLNGRSLASKALPSDASPRLWRVNFEPGTLRAIGKSRGRTVASHELRTGGKPAKIVLTTDHPKLAPVWDDVAYVEAAVADEQGVIVPNASDLVTFKVSGPGVIAGVDNGDNSSHEPFQVSARHAYHGRCIAIMRATAATGHIVLSGSSPGLAGGTITLEAIGR